MTTSPKSRSTFPSFRNVDRGTKGDFPEETTPNMILKERKEIIQMKKEGKVCLAEGTIYVSDGDGRGCGE